MGTTAILFLPATGNFAHLIEEPEFSPKYTQVSIAALIIYGFLVVVPGILQIMLHFYGSETCLLNLRQLVCVYGYSLVPTLPASMLCIAPTNFVRWIACLLGLAVSIIFIHRQLWASFSTSVTVPWCKYAAIALVCSAQAVIFFVYRIAFLPV